MLQLIQPMASIFIGLCMFVYGIIHSISRYPGGQAFAQLVANLPNAGSVLLFVLGLLAMVAGVVLLISGARNVRSRWHRFNQLARHSQQPVRPPYDDEDWQAEY